MRNAIHLILAGVVLAAIAACEPTDLYFADLPIETSIVFYNFSTRYYAAFGLRAHVDPGEGEPGELEKTPLMAPGVASRVNLVDYIGHACPVSIDVEIYLYRRVNDDRPIGEDEEELVESTPIVAGRIEDIPGPCGWWIPLGIYTIANWDAPEGVARVKFAQGSTIDEMILGLALFPNEDAVWEVHGVEDAALAADPPPPLMEKQPIAGRVTYPDGTGVEGVVVLLGTKFRVRLDDDDPTNDPDSDYSDPIDYTITDADGAFAFERPPGVYRVEFFSDVVAFRPGSVEVESPIEIIEILAEPW